MFLANIATCIKAYEAESLSSYLFLLISLTNAETGCLCTWNYWSKFAFWNVRIKTLFKTPSSHEKRSLANRSFVTNLTTVNRESPEAVNAFGFHNLSASFKTRLTILTHCFVFWGSIFKQGITASYQVPRSSPYTIILLCCMLNIYI
jgi:hypothetical protein